MEEQPLTQAMELSPTPMKRQTTLSFFDALREVLNGESITKLEWNDKECYLKLVNERLKIYKPDTKMFHDLIVSEADMAGTDWIILPQ